MNKRKQSLKDRIIKKLGGYTESEYQMLKMPLPILEVERIDTEQIMARTVLYDAKKFSGVKISRL